MRLFIAINFNEEVKNNICRIIEKMKEASVRGNFTRKENLHLTLVFLGEIPVHKVKAIERAMDNFRRNLSSANLTQIEDEDHNSWSNKHLEISFSGYGNFSDALWIGIEKNDNLSKLQKQLSDDLASQGFRIEKREFRPHITLCRRAMLPDGFDRRAMAAAVGAVTGIMRMKADHFDLMLSERVDGRMVYTPIHTTML